jgi:hypothetical protein
MQNANQTEVWEEYDTMPELGLAGLFLYVAHLCNPASVIIEE